MLARIVALSAILALAWGVLAASASADGDPASDVLATQSLFLPWDTNVPARQQAELGALLQTAQRSGYPIRLALIASASDLGSVTALWRKPQSYADYLGEELSLVYPGPLLVVMPNGFGLYRDRLSPAAASAALAGARALGGRVGLGAVAISAIERLAAASGHPLTAPSAAARVSSSQPRRGYPAAVLALALGSLLIAVAWAASLRARPFRFTRRGAIFR